MDLEAYGKDIMSGKDGEALKKVTGTQAWQRMAARFEGTEIEAAARRGDMEKLSGMLKNILATEEGQSFARQVMKAVEKNGR